MPFATSTYRGDADYSIDCTGDAVTGDEIRFERATFSGDHARRARKIRIEERDHASC